MYDCICAHVCMHVRVSEYVVLYMCVRPEYVFVYECMYVRYFRLSSCLRLSLLIGVFVVSVDRCVVTRFTPRIEKEKERTQPFVPP